MRARPPRTWTVPLALALMTAALGVWRASCILAGPDVDTDAYAHHMIARAILDDPRDLAVHWVWLPLFHYLQVPLVALGGTMNDVRWSNLVLAAALPLVLFAYVRRTARSGEARVPADVTALLAAVFAGACPIGMQMGTTAQPEPLFALLVLGVAVTLEEGRDLAAAALLGAAVILRYEAWAILVSVAALIGLAAARRLRRTGPPNGAEAHVPPSRAAPGHGRAAPSWLVALLPALLIGAWAALRRPVDGEWFGFLRQTQAFATGAMAMQATQNKAAGGHGLVPLARDLLYYPLFVPARVLGPLMPLVPFGVLRTVRQQGARFVLVFAACLGFISLSWARHASLGLDRHFVAVVPLYATFAAQGLAAAADASARVSRRFTGAEGRSVQIARAVAAVLAVASIGGLAVELDVWMRFWRDDIVRGWPDRAALGQYLRSLAGAPTIFCDDATIEIASGLDRRRFDRHWVDDPHTWARMDEVARARGPTYVATWRRKLRGHEGDGEIVFRAGFDPTDRDGTGVAAMRIDADGSRSER
jgi:hypothetical protein